VDIVALQIPDVLVLAAKKYGDERGFFSEVYKQSALASAGVDASFVQDNHSYSAQSGVLRGLHYQAPPAAQGKLVRVIRGAILDVAIDIRVGSPSYGQHVAAELSYDAWNQIWVPPGFAHGFCTLTDHCEVLYKVTAEYAPALEQGLRWNDPALNIAWPFSGHEMKLSPRDQAWPDLNDIRSPFRFGA
jgi:dTDP-4-dehydrorhamnose 3,5-epimerase